MSSKTVFTAAAAFVVVWAILGFMDVSNFTTSGYSTDFDNNVTQVVDGGPAAMAGMQVGDRIRSVNGVPVEDSRGMSAMPRPSVGETRAIVVGRGGQDADVALTYDAQSGSQSVNSYIGILIGLAFMGMGLWAFLTAPGRNTRILALAGAFFGIVLTGGPYLGTSMLANIVGGLIFLCVAMAFAALLHFMIVFPDKPDPNKWIVYGPGALIGLFVLGLGIFQPDATSGLNRFVQILFVVWIFGYIGLALFHMVRTWIRASAEGRSRHGLTTLLVGTVVGLGILLLSALVGILLPTVTIPGGQWLSISLALVPIAAALAAVKSARADAGAPA